MTWATLYLICFVAGFLFSLFAFVGGHLHFPHIPGGHVHGSYSGAKLGHGHILSYLNPMSLAVFLAWFGGTGYLLTRYSSIWFVIGLGVAVLSGLTGAGIVYLFLKKVLMADDQCLDPADFEMAGVLGRVSSFIRQGGTGEIIYSQEGTRRTCGARAEEGTAIPKGAEIIVTRDEKGIAYVRLWTDMAGDDSQESNSASKAAQ